MDWFETELLDCAACGEDVHTCRLRRPDDYSFAAGQYFMLQLATDDAPISKPFSHACAPDDPWIEFTTHFSASPYKQRLASLAPGDAVRISQPLGRLGVPADSGPVTFLVGGVGITPVRSIIRDAVTRGTGLLGTLIYGNRSPACVPYRAELDGYADAGIRTVHVFEHPGAEQTAAEGFVTAELVRRYADPAVGVFVATGPPAMVDAMERVMDELGVETGRRMVERFGGK